ncbi:MAG TPA: sigma-70 family RNA polymerase sigma factor [Chitinophagaceae bacterium]|nr:sigma-70 family RNA polymerase sigma factor [Chitinophagaceae bacterium]
MQEEDEKKLVKKALSGDQRAFKTLVDQYERLVLHIVSPLVGISQDREDICQDVFVKVYQGLSSFKHNSRLSTWIGNIAYNTSVNFLRKKRAFLLDDLKISGNENDETIRTDIAPLSEYSEFQELITPEQELVKKETRLSVSEAIDKLPKLHKMTVILFHYEELSLKEIGMILNVPENTVKSYLFRGRNKLKDLIKL